MEYIVRVYEEHCGDKLRLFAEHGIKVLFEDDILTDFAIVKSNKEYLEKLPFVHTVTECRNNGRLDI